MGDLLFSIGVTVWGSGDGIDNKLITICARRYSLCKQASLAFLENPNAWRTG